MTKRKIVSEQWYKVVKYEDGEEITIPYPDHRKNPDDSPPSTFNGGLSHDEQYCDPIDLRATKRRSVISRGK